MLQAVRGSGTILLVDNDAVARASASDVLSGIGYHVLEAADCHEALRSLAGKEARIDLVIADAEMLVSTTSNQFITFLAELSPNLPVLFISGDTDDPALRLALGAGRRDHLPRPFSRRQLIRKISDLAEETRRRPRMAAVRARFG